MKRSPFGLLGQAFERALWSSRLLVLVAVIASVLLAIVTFYLALVDVSYSLIDPLVGSADLSLGSQAYDDLRNDALTHIIKALDQFLIGSILLLFAFGLYELFISNIDVADRSETGQLLLHVRNLDELKERVARLVLLVLVIEFFQHALRLRYEGPLDLLYLAGGILLVGGGLYLTGSRAPGGGGSEAKETEDLAPHEGNRKGS